MKLEPARTKRFPLVRLLIRVMIIALTLIFFFGALIVPFEIDAPNSKIHTLFDGVWWASTTVSTVGYGDTVPVTAGGKIVAMILQLTGASIFFGALVGTVTVYIHRSHENYRWMRIQEKLERIEDKQKDLASKLEFLVKNRGTSVKKSRHLGL